ncbi:hypothetical protein P3T20_000196 [Paraburkholderia sp. GAS206C]|jgi:hypothetical protein
MMCKTDSPFVRYPFRRRVWTLAHKAVGFAIFVSGLAVIVLHLLQQISNG